MLDRTFEATNNTDTLTKKAAYSTLLLDQNRHRKGLEGCLGPEDRSCRMRRYKFLKLGAAFSFINVMERGQRDDGQSNEC